MLYDGQDHEYFAVYDVSGRVVASNSDLGQLRATLPSGAVTDAPWTGEAIRVIALRSEGALPLTVIVGETTRSRSNLLVGLLQRSLVPQVVLLLLLGWLLWRQITRELTPLGELQRALERRSSSDLDPIAGEPVSSDVSRLRDAVNALLARVGLGVQAQREFAGNVAHDLRTPLAGIRALAEYGLGQKDPEVWRRQLEQIVHSEARAAGSSTSCSPSRWPTKRATASSSRRCPYTSWCAVSCCRSSHAPMPRGSSSKPRVSMRRSPRWPRRCCSKAY